MTTGKIALLALALAATTTMLPMAAADTGAWVGYDGVTTFCVLVSTSELVSTDAEHCQGGTTELAGDVSVGVRSGGVEVCVLVDDDGQVRPSCSPCRVLDDVTRVDADVIICDVDAAALR